MLQGSAKASEQLFRSPARGGILQVAQQATVQGEDATLLFMTGYGTFPFHLASTGGPAAVSQRQPGRGGGSCSVCGRDGAALDRGHGAGDCSARAARGWLIMGGR